MKKRITFTALTLFLLNYNILLAQPTNVTAGISVGISDNANRLLGKITFGSSQPVDINNFPTTASTTSVSIRCVNTAGNAFEACGGGSTPVTDSDDGLVASGQTGLALGVKLQYYFDGVNWSRWDRSVTQSGTWNIGTLTTITNSVAVTGTFWQSTQPVSGTVTSNAGTGTFLVGDGVGALNIICDSGCGGASSFNDNTAFTFGTTAINVSGGVLDDVTPNAATENSAAAPRISANRMFLMQLGDGAGNERRANVTAANALVVDGSASTQPVSGTVAVSTTAFGIVQTTTSNDVDVLTIPSVTIGIFPDNEPINLNQLAGIAISSGVGISGTGTQRTASLIHDGVDTALVTAGGALVVDGSAVTQPVSGTFWQTTQPISGTITANAGTGTFTVGDGVGALNVIVDSLPSVTIGTFPDNEPINVAQVGGTAIVSGRCEREEPIRISINQIANTQIITGIASEKIYICSIHLITATAQNIALVDGTGTTCATAPSGVVGFGGATAATGWNFAANSGIVLPSDKNPYGETSTAADNVCLFQSGAGQVSGGLTYVSLAP